jgi:hypothetical protein
MALRRSRTPRLTRKLICDEGTCVLDQETWTEILLFLQKWGWKPEQLSMNYLATGVRVSDEDAVRLVEAGDRIFQAALADPRTFYPVRPDMGKLSEAVEMSRSGGFLISEAE